jgi:hypothetical protein
MTRRALPMLLLVVSLVIVGGSVAAVAATSPGITDCGTGDASRWRDGSRTGATWILLSSRNQTCAQARRWVAPLSAKTGSSGAIDQVSFRLDTPEPAACVVRRSLLIGICTIPVAAGAAKTVLLMAKTAINDSLRAAFVSSPATLTSTVVAVTGRPADGLVVTDPGAGGAGGKRPDECSLTDGPSWRIAGVTGTRWRSYGGGGLPCLSAKGWVADVGARLVAHAGGRPTSFAGGDRWICHVGTREAMVGVCARPRRSTEPGADLEPKYVVVLPGSGQDQIAARVRANGYDAAVRQMGLPFAEVDAVDACGVTKAAIWQADSDKWRLATTGGYPCATALFFARVLSAWSLAGGARRAGVLGNWRCTSTAETLATRCVWTVAWPSDGRERAPLAIGLVPDKPGAAASLEALMTGP